MKEDNAVAVIFDLEYTAWEGSLTRAWSGDNEDPEIIQIGAVKLFIEDQGLFLGSEFSTLVKPACRPRLSEYIINLTGIDQETLDHKGLEFSDAINKFSQFIGEGGIFCSNGDDWSFLQRNCEINQIKNPLSQIQYRNLRPLLAQHLKLPVDSVKLHSYQIGGLGEIGEVDRVVPGNPHNALDDARAVASQVCEIKESLVLDELLSPDCHTQ